MVLGGVYGGMEKVSEWTKSPGLTGCCKEIRIPSTVWVSRSMGGNAVTFYTRELSQPLQEAKTVSKRSPSSDDAAAKGVRFVKRKEERKVKATKIEPVFC